jgi:hypothetical protein
VQKGRKDRTRSRVNGAVRFARRLADALFPENTPTVVALPSRSDSTQNWRRLIESNRINREARCPWPWVARAPWPTVHACPPARAGLLARLPSPSPDGSPASCSREGIHACLADAVLIRIHLAVNTHTHTLWLRIIIDSIHHRPGSVEALKQPRFNEADSASAAASPFARRDLTKTLVGKA